MYMALPYASLGCLSLHSRGWVSTLQVGGCDACRAVRDRRGAPGVFLLALTPGAQVPAEKAAGGLPVPEGGLIQLLNICSAHQPWSTFV